MTHYERLKHKRLGDVLVDEGIASEQIVIAALQQSQRTGRLLSDVLLESREVSEYELSRVIVEQYQTPFIDLKGYTLHKELIEEFPARLLHAAGVVPLERFGRQVCFACQEVPPPDVAMQLKEHSPAGIYVFSASAVEIRNALDTYAPIGEGDEVDKEAVAAAGAPISLGSLDEDTAWKDLFDTANESVLSEIVEEDPDE